MATTTTNYELTKAGYNDIPDIETINDNMDTLDSSLVVGESNDDVMETITKTTGWTNAEPVTLGDKFQSAMTKISTMIKNLKWIYKFIGSTDISSIGDGTITNAISTLSSGKLNASDVKTSLTDTSTSHALSTASGKALNDALNTIKTTSLTYSANSYVTESGADLTMYSVGKVGVIRCNLSVTSLANNETDKQIGLYSNTTFKTNFYIVIPSQTNKGNMLMTVTTDGRVRINNLSGSTISGFYRASIPVVLA